MNFDALLQLVAVGLAGTNIKIKGKTIPLGGILSTYEQNKDLIDSIFKSKPHVSVPASDRPQVGGLPDDKIVVPLIPPTPAPIRSPEPQPVVQAYTSLRVGVKQAQFNRELFPEQYTEDNKDGFYRPALVPVYNRKSKIWFDATPFKSALAVQHDEGEKDGILWGVVWHGLFNGIETTLKADEHITQDTPNGADHPIQVVNGTSVGFGFSAWDFAQSFLAQINVGEAEGDYEIFAELPKFGLVSNSVHFKVS